MWSTGEGNGKPLQYSCLANPMNSMKRQSWEVKGKWAYFNKILSESWFLVSFLLETKASWGNGISRNFSPLLFFRATQFWYIKGTSKRSGEGLDLMGSNMAFENRGGQFSFFLLLISIFWEVSKGEHLAKAPQLVSRRTRVHAEPAFWVDHNHTHGARAAKGWTDLAHLLR